MRLPLQALPPFLPLRMHFTVVVAAENAATPSPGQKRSTSLITTLIDRIDTLFPMRQKNGLPLRTLYW
jgi:hypothetical protein